MRPSPARWCPSRDAGVDLNLDLDHLPGDRAQRLVGIDDTVGIGPVGAQRTEIATGLAAGQTVVLANLNQPLPGSATTTTKTTSGQGPPNGFSGGAPPGRKLTD